ncbi:uncharacterized protein MYCFIDRAFT_173007 [Pseudocercospora fijiensis CIRAD86]|uniref:Uncharacterized protein n=1 Tax=Pseudocercospora fijiensis (strain CIRAD86) TaxID=383855 RepID=M3B3I7_PSEFD|nr:uncharacterized protein MYCFIDRAFT_173007 [Pseudocercospora fijiensis CIRAD86]EME83937.1 hypothetical protein MYCFIDRAFT_173007 [Pseudocercospora fijiensis CIRAD86]
METAGSRLVSFDDSKTVQTCLLLQISPDMHIDLRHGESSIQSLTRDDAACQPRGEFLKAGGGRGEAGCSLLGQQEMMTGSRGEVSIDLFLTTTFLNHLDTHPSPIFSFIVLSNTFPSIHATNTPRLEDPKFERGVPLRRSRSLSEPLNCKECQIVGQERAAYRSIRWKDLSTSYNYCVGAMSTSHRRITLDNLISTKTMLAILCGHEVVNESTDESNVYTSILAIGGNAGLQISESSPTFNLQHATREGVWYLWFMRLVAPAVRSDGRRCPVLPWFHKFDTEATDRTNGMRFMETWRLQTSIVVVSKSKSADEG